MSASQSTTDSSLTRRSDAARARRVRLRARELARLRCQNLELDILNVRQEIAMLANLRRLLYQRTLNRPDDLHGGRFEKVVREFYEISDRAYVESVDVVQFMRTSFDETIAVGPENAQTERSLDELLMLLGEMSLELDEPKAELLQVHVTQRGTQNGLVKVYAKSRCTSALRGVLLDKYFPHLQDEAPWLRAKLIGRTFVSINDGQFTFDTRNGRIVYFHFSPQYAKGILDLATSVDEWKILKAEARIVEVLDDDNEKKNATTTGKPIDTQSPTSVHRALSGEKDRNDETATHEDANGA